MKTTAIKKSSRGFTLIEVMTVVSIVAILASVAIPELSARLRQAKRAEQEMMLGKIERSVINFYNDNSRFPIRVNATRSTLTAPWNPAVLSSTSKFDPKATGWQDLEVPLDGRDRYFSFRLAGTRNGATVTWTLTVRSDLDNDGVIGLRTRTWNLTRNQWLLASDVKTGDLEY